MSRWVTKTLVLCLLVTLGIFFGVDLATRGVERGYAPLVPEHAADIPLPQESPEQAKSGPEDGSELHEEAAREELDYASFDGEMAQKQQSNLDRLADKTGKLIQFTAQHGIEWFVTIFDGLLD